MSDFNLYKYFSIVYETCKTISTLFMLRIHVNIIVSENRSLLLNK